MDALLPSIANRSRNCQNSAHIIPTFTNSFANIQNALYTIPIEVGIPALGVGVLMIAGEFDLSVGVNFVFSSIVMAQLATNGLNDWLAALIGLAIGTGIGLLNGIITLRLNIPSFITTLGTSFFWSAAVLFVHGASSQPFTPDPVFATLTAGSIGPIPATFLWWVALALAFYALLQRNRIGNHIFAVGGNKQAATATGVRVDRTKLLAFALTGACAALGGILAASYIGNIAPTTGEALAVRATEALFEYLRSLRTQGLSSVLVTHNLYDAYRICNRFVVMARGQVIFQATQKETSVEELTEHVSRG